MSGENQIEVAEEQRAPLLVAAQSHQNEECTSSTVSIPNQRLASLDVFRGLTVAVRPHFSTISLSFPHLI